ncbi:hypothetical protein DFR78_11139 [Halanaerobium sp. MA284_MarDTE_T2]|nr:hypothetical protein DFR78_11139 [Halanaerobium sp. MA284_MarDTE_T2]
MAIVTLDDIKNAKQNLEGIAKKPSWTGQEHSAK